MSRRGEVHLAMARHSNRRKAGAASDETPEQPYLEPEGAGHRFARSLSMASTSPLRAALIDQGRCGSPFPVSGNCVLHYTPPV